VTREKVMVSDLPKIAYVLSLIAGILIILGGLVWLLAGSVIAVGFGIGLGAAILGLIGIIVGIIVIYGAMRLNTNPNEHLTWGAVILILSILSLVFAGGGFYIGAVLGIIGGVLAIIWKI
jgi:hypothetical protein